jgi:uncharacterized protein YggE
MKVNPFNVAAALIAALFACHPAGAQETSPSTLTVNGRAVVSAVPDMSVIAFTVESNRPRGAEAVEENAAKSKTLIDALKRRLDSGDQIRTGNYSVSPVYDKEDRLRPAGYRVRNEIIVETRSVQNTGELIDAAAAAGASGMGGLVFKSSREGEYEVEAAALAVKNARRTAAALAEAAGVSIRGVRQIQYSPRHPAPRFMAEARMADASTPIEPGVLSIEAEVMMVFDID